MLSLEEGDEAELKCVDRVLDQEPVLDDAMLRLAAFVRERYFCTFYQAVRAILPVGLWFSDSGYLYPGCRSALGGAKHPEAGSRRRFAFFGGPGRRGNLQRLEKGLPG